MLPKAGLVLPSQFRSFIESFSKPCAVLGRGFQVLAHNCLWCETYGLEGPLVGQSHFDHFPDFPPHWLEALHAAMEGRAYASDRDTFFRADGRMHHVRWTLTPWRELDGSVAGVVITSEDITERVENERRLHESEDFAKAFFANSPIGLNLCQIDGLWLESNAAFLEIIGYDAGEADGGLTYWDLTPRKYDAQEAAQLAELAATGRYGPYEKEFIRKDGSHVPVRLNGFFIERDGKRYIWSIIEDITAQRALEAELEKQRLRALQASKLATLGEMAAAFAHEINNPLAIIEAYAFELEDAAQRGDLVLVKEAVGAIRSATQRAGTIVGGLRRHSRDEHAKEAREEKVGRLVAEALDLCRARLRNRGVDLLTDLRSTGTARVKAIEVTQVVLNLVNNAFDAVRELDERWVRVQTWDTDEHVCIAVEDNGPEMTPEARERLFEPFFTTKRVGEGTGLGLSISRTIVESVGGTLSLDPAPRTRFVVELPRGGPTP